MNNIMKAGIVLTAALALTACSPIDNNYTGSATIENATPSKRSCNITVRAEDGSKKNLLTAKSFDCYNMKAGTAVKVVNGKIQ